MRHSSAASVLKEYKRLLTLKALHADTADTHGGAPPVRDFWRCHLIDTAAYAEHCSALAGSLLHHRPDFDVTTAEGDARAHRTLEAYRKAFGEVPPALWNWGARPRPAARQPEHRRRRRRRLPLARGGGDDGHAVLGHRPRAGAARPLARRAARRRDGGAALREVRRGERRAELLSTAAPPCRRRCGCAPAATGSPTRSSSATRGCRRAAPSSSPSPPSASTPTRSR